MSLEMRVLEKLASCFDEDDLSTIVQISEFEEELEKVAAGAKRPENLQEFMDMVERNPAAKKALIESGQYDKALAALKGAGGGITRQGMPAGVPREARKPTGDWLPGRKKQSSAISEEEAAMLAEYLGPEKVAAVIQAAEDELALEKEAQAEADYHYRLGEIMAQGFQDALDKTAAEHEAVVQEILEDDSLEEHEKEAMLGAAFRATKALGQNVPAMGKALGRAGSKALGGDLSGAAKGVGRLGPLAGRIGHGLALPAAGAAGLAGGGYMAGRSRGKGKEIKIKVSGDAEIYRAMAVLSEAGLLEDDVTKEAASEKERMLEARAKQYKKKMEEEEEEDEDEEDEKKSFDAEIYQALATLSEAGLLKESSQSGKGLPDHLKKHKYPADRDGDGKVNEPSIVEKKSYEQEIYEAIDLLTRAGLISE
jgi:hypothetical protein